MIAGLAVAGQALERQEKPSNAPPAPPTSC